MSIWELLEIEPTTDIKKIKIAYATVAKKYHPEDYPEMFKKIQAAYKEALKYAKNPGDTECPIIINNPETNQQKIQYGEKNTEFEIEKNIRNEQKRRQAERLQKNKTASTTLDYDYTEVLEENVGQATWLIEQEAYFWKKTDALIWHPWLRNNVMVWECVFENETYYNFFGKKFFRAYFLEKISSVIYIWHPNIIFYFESFLQKIPIVDDDEKWKIEEQQILSQIKEKILKGSILNEPTSVSIAEKKIYYSLYPKYLLDNQEDENKKELQLFLDSYFMFATEKEDELRRVFNNSRTKNGLRLNFVYIIIVIVVVCIMIAQFKNFYVKMQYLNQQDIVPIVEETNEQNHDNEKEIQKQFEQEAEQFFEDYQKQLESYGFPVKP